MDRALELCQEPIDRTLSHTVKVDRYALTHVLRDRTEQISQLNLAKKLAEVRERSFTDFRKTLAYADDDLTAKIIDKVKTEFAKE